jgi:hypothetical protein
MLSEMLSIENGNNPNAILFKYELTINLNDQNLKNCKIYLPTNIQHKRKE